MPMIRNGTPLAEQKSCKIDIQEKVNAIKKRIVSPIQRAGPAGEIPASSPEAPTIPAATRTKTAIRKFRRPWTAVVPATR